MFQSTYLYKVRRLVRFQFPIFMSFNPRTYIRYDLMDRVALTTWTVFQSTYLYKVRRDEVRSWFHRTCFNPRTYIRYDNVTVIPFDQELVSIHVPI